MGYLTIRKATTVGELIEALKALPPETLVVQSRDEEGNGFLPLAGVGECRYLPQQDMLTPTEENAPGSRLAVCLWPAHE